MTDGSWRKFSIVESRGSLRCSAGISATLIVDMDAKGVDTEATSEGSGDRESASASECFLPDR